MRKKMIIATAVGVLSLGGMAVAVPVLADTDGESSSSTGSRAPCPGWWTTGRSPRSRPTRWPPPSARPVSGRGGHHGGERLGLETAAEALGMTEDELRTALEPDGTSLADVAEDQGVDVVTLVDALVQAQQDRIAQAVEDGRLTQEEADERLADLEERVTERVNSDAPGPGSPWRAADPSTTDDRLNGRVAPSWMGAAPLVPVTRGGNVRPLRVGYRLTRTDPQDMLPADADGTPVARGNVHPGRDDPARPLRRQRGRRRRTAWMEDAMTATRGTHHQGRREAGRQGGPRHRAAPVGSARRSAEVWPRRAPTSRPVTAATSSAAEMFAARTSPARSRRVTSPSTGATSAPPRTAGAPSPR